MGRRGTTGVAVALMLLAALQTAVLVSGAPRSDTRLSSAQGSSSTTTSASPETTAPTTSTTVTTTTAPVPPTTAAPPPAPRRVVIEQDWTPYAVVGGVTLHHPSRRIERIGFHESNHDGAQHQQALPTAVRPLTLESRERGTGAQTAADLVADPAHHIRSPVTGTVKRAGSYVLYCKDRDFFVVVEPDARPGWEVKVLHMTSMNVRPGQRVTAGETVLADGPRQLPFESQVDELNPGNAWPHVHIEVVDPTIKDRPGPGGGCP